MIRAILMLEVLGRPPAYVKEILSNITNEIGKQKDVKILSKKIAEPKELKDNNNLYTSFAEIEVETELIRLMAIIYNFMPSHVEIITPEEITMSNTDANIFMNELITRLHKYDEIAKSILMEKQILAEKIKSGELKLDDVQDAPASKKKRL